MKKITPKEVPTCACGKEDLYEVWLQQQEAGKEDEVDVTKVPQTQATIISHKDEAISKHNIDDQT
jgi:hypothetical protein